ARTVAQQPVISKSSCPIRKNRRMLLVTLLTQEMSSTNSSRLCSVCSDCQPSPGLSVGRSRLNLSSVVKTFASIASRNSALSKIFHTKVGNIEITSDASIQGPLSLTMGCDDPSDSAT